MQRQRKVDGSDTTFRPRLRFLRILIALALALLACRLIDLQLFRAHQYQRDARLQLRQTFVLPALRGGIFDRNGAVLAMSVPTKEIIADDFQVAHPVAEAAALAPLLGKSASTIQPMLQRRSGYVVLAKTIDEQRAATISKDSFPGITMLDTAVRKVPNGALGSSVTGVTNASGVGASGLEYQFNSSLAGSNGSETLLETPYGVGLPQGGALHTAKAVAGSGLELTLDQPLQYVTEQALGSEIASSHAVSGTAIVMDVHTGQILSMANLVAPAETGSPVPVPASMPGDTGVPGVQQAQNNLAVTQTYEPGSVFKLVTFSAAIEDGLISPTTTFGVPYSVKIDGKVFHDAETHGPMTMTATDILAQSSNIGTYEIANQLGESRLLAQVNQLGFGQSTGLNFPGESPGLLMNAARWEPTDIAALPIGQVDAATPLQVLDAYNAVANGGIFVSPSLVRASVSQDGRVSPVAPSQQRRAFSSATATTLTNMLEQVVASGTGTTAAVPGYLIAGKTGTSQIPTPGQASYIAGAYNATFVGFAPANHPVLSVIVVLQRPTPNFFGGQIAAPVFGKIMSYALHRYGIPTSPGGNGAQAASSKANFAQDIT